MKNKSKINNKIYNQNDPRRYEDIMNLPHHVSDHHIPMEPLKRAAQFAPFAALTGYGDLVDETGRLTKSRIELDESKKEENI